MSTDSILTSIKESLGMTETYSAFDAQIVMHINSAFATMRQLGVGPTTAFTIQDKTKTWDEFIDGEEGIESVRSYIYVNVRLIFDPPQNSATLAAFQEMKRELEFRLMVASEENELKFKALEQLVESDTPVVIEEPLIYLTGDNNG